MIHPADRAYFLLPRWGSPGHVVLMSRLDYPDRSYLRTRTRPALLTCFTCYQELPLGGREFKQRHAYHFWSHYEPVWQAAPRRPAPHRKESSMDVLGSVFIVLVWLAVVAYLAWVGWGALRGIIK